MDCIIERCESGKNDNMIKPILYRLPSDFKLRLKWCQQIARFNNQAIFVNDTDGKIRYICSDHFDESDFEVTTFESHLPQILNNNCVRKLKSEAIPTKFFAFTNNQQSYLSKNLPNGYGYEFDPTTTNESKYEHTYNAIQDATIVTQFNQQYNHLIDDNIYEEIAGDMVDEFKEEVVTAASGVCVGIGNDDDECDPAGCFEDDSGGGGGSGGVGCDNDGGNGVSVDNRTGGGDHEPLHLPYLTHLHPQHTDQLIDNVSTIGHVDEVVSLIDSTQQQQFQISHLISLDKPPPQHHNHQHHQPHQQQQQQQSQTEKQLLQQSQSTIIPATVATTTSSVTEIIKPDSSNIGLKDDLLLHSIVDLSQKGLEQKTTLQPQQLNNQEPIDSLKLSNVEQLCQKILDEQRRVSDVISIIKYSCCDKTEFNPQIPTTSLVFNDYLLETDNTTDNTLKNNKLSSTPPVVNNNVCRLCLMVKENMLTIDYVEMSNLYEKVTTKKFKKISKDLSNIICSDCINLLKQTSKTIDLLHKVDDYWCKMQDESKKYKNINKNDEHEDDDGLTVLTQPTKQYLTSTATTTATTPPNQKCDYFLGQPILEQVVYSGNDDLMNEFNYLIDFDNSSAVEIVEDAADLINCDSNNLDNINVDCVDQTEYDYDHYYGFKTTNTTNLNSYEQIKQPARINSTLRRNTVCSDLHEKYYRTEQTIINVPPSPPSPAAPQSPPPQIKTAKLSENSNGLFECDICNDTFSAQLILDNHQIRHQYSMDQLFECDQCKQLFPSQKRLTKHFDRVHNFAIDKKIRHRCLKCDEVFSLKHLLYRHNFLVHLNNDQPPKQRRKRCHSGDGDFVNNTSKYKIPVHWTKTKFNAKNLSKTKSKISSQQSSQQQQNQQQHQHQRNQRFRMATSFKCHLCIDSCHKSLISLKDHFFKSHTGDWDEIVQTHCLQCPAIFDNIVELEDHRISHHNYQ